MREQAEALMVDSCTISGKGSISWNTATNDYDDAAGGAVYSGPCQVQVTDSITTSGETVGEQLVVTERVTIKIPVSADPVPINSVVTITAVADVSDSALVGRRYRVTGSHAKTFATSRRLPCELVTS